MGSHNDALHATEAVNMDLIPKPDSIEVLLKELARDLATDRQQCQKKFFL